MNTAISGGDQVEGELSLFVDVARAQPFGDGNKRTALFAANALLLGQSADVLLSIPYDEDDQSVSDSFNELLARAYVFGEHEGVKSLLRELGISALGPRQGE